jgi:hypothetical protein
MFHCGVDVEESIAPTTPQWVQKSLPAEWPERGIDAHESNSIYLEWDSNPEENIAAYILYRAEYFDSNDSLGDYSILASLGIDSNISCEYIDSEAKIRRKYYYKIRAEDLAENKSAYSDSLAYLLLPQLFIAEMSPNSVIDTLNSERLLHWFYRFNFEMEDYCVTLLDHQNRLITRAVLSPVDYVSGAESWYIPDSIDLESEKIYKWRIDIGARYDNGYENSGSESPWATFISPSF